MNPVSVPVRRPVMPRPPAVAPIAPPSIAPTLQSEWLRIMTGPKSRGTGPRHARRPIAKMERFA